MGGYNFAFRMGDYVFMKMLVALTCGRKNIRPRMGKIGELLDSIFSVFEHPLSKILSCIVWNAVISMPHIFGASDVLIFLGEDILSLSGYVQMMSESGLSDSCKKESKAGKLAFY